MYVSFYIKNMFKTLSLLHQTFLGEMYITQWKIHHKNITNYIDYKCSKQGIIAKITIPLIAEVMSIKPVVQLKMYIMCNYENLGAFITAVNASILEVFPWTCDVFSLTLQYLVNAIYIT